MSNSASPNRHSIPLPSAWPVWVVPAVLAFIQVAGSFGAQSGRRGGEGPPWAETGRDPMMDMDTVVGATPLDALGVGLLLAGPAFLLLRRRNPVVALAGVGAVTLLYLLRAYTYGPMMLSPAVAMIAAVAAGRRIPAWAGTFAYLAGYFALTTVIGVPGEQRGQDGKLFPVEEPAPGGVTFAIGWLLVALITGELFRMRAGRVAEAARTRAEEERRQASEERLRMARELHDVLAHNISMINVQAGVALHLIDDDPGQARTALAAIKDASKEALTEMRSVIGALRAEGERAPRAPTAGIGKLDDLLARARSAGLRVESETDGTPRPLPAGTDLAAYRIVQESLTNVGRYGGGGPVTARVRIAYGEDEVAVSVEDDGQGVSLMEDHHGGGSGINGMRERAQALGGRFSAGPRPGGGFAVHAVLPASDDVPAGVPDDARADQTLGDT